MKAKKLIQVLICLFSSCLVDKKVFSQECAASDGRYYGQRNVTVSGRPCFSWDFSKICSKGITDVSSASTHNYCRNPADNTNCYHTQPWCYIDNENSRWEFCDLPRCGSEPPPSCSDPMGMGDGRIKDEQISSSPIWFDTNRASNARINNTTEDNGWIAYNSYPQFSYLSVNLINPKKITKIYVKGVRYYFTTKFKILYSMGGYMWNFYSESPDDPNMAVEFEGNHGDYDIAIAYFKIPFVATHITVVPVSYSNSPALKLEIFGCEANDTVPTVTEISQIKTDAYWPLGSSPFIVRSALVVPDGISLTIEAGVKVVFVGRSASLTVSGCLILKGLKGLEVQFLSEYILTYLGASTDYFNNNNPMWPGIILNYNSKCNITKLENFFITGSGITTDVTAFEFNNIHLSNSRVGLLLTSRYTTNISISECLFKINWRGIQGLFFSFYTIKSSQFEQNENGIIFDGGISYSARELSLNLENVNFQNNRIGVYINMYDYANYMPAISSIGCNFINHEIAMHFRIHSMPTSYMLQHSNFTLSHVYAVSYNSYYDLTVDNCIFEISQVNYGVQLERGLRNLVLFLSSFQDFSGYALYVSSDSYVSIINISQSVFKNNSQSSCVYLNGPGRRGNIFLFNNTFIENKVDAVIYLNLNILSEITISKNIFMDFLSKYEISNNIDWSHGYSVRADANYWGIDNFSNISNRIFDFDDDLSKSSVSFATIYKNTNLDEVLDSSNAQSWFYLNGTIGGKLTRSIILKSANNLTVTRSIFISNATCLEIIGPLTLQFLEGTGILVDGGCLKTYEGVVLMSSDDKKLWKGLKFVNSTDSAIREITIFNTDLAMESIDSTIIIDNSIFSSRRLMKYTGTIFSKFSLSNSMVTCSGACFDINTSDMDFKIVNSTVTSTQNSNFVRNTGHLNFDIHNSSVRVESLLFEYQSSSSRVTIIDSSFSGLLDLRKTAARYRLQNTDFTAREICVNINNEYGEAITISIINNSFFCGTRFLQHLVPFGPRNHIFEIFGNTFKQGSLYIFQTYPQMINITNNVFSSDVSTERFIEIYIAGEDNDNNKKNEVHLIDNVFKNIVGPQNSYLLYFYCLAGYYELFKSDIYLTRNSFKNNTVTSVVATNCPGLTSEKNIMNNPNSNYELKVIGGTKPMSPYPIYFTRNFWGTFTDFPLQRIYDEKNEKSVQKAIISPWFKDVSMTILSFAKDDFFKSTNEIGGTLTEETTIVYRETPYNVIDVITIPFGITLIIEPGVALNFVSGGLGIIIEGDLLAVGNETHEISFNSIKDNFKWMGIHFQKRNSDLVMKQKLDWWQLKYKGIWRTVVLYENSYKKATADVLCKQAGFESSAVQQIVQCDQLAEEENSKLLPCLNTSLPGIQVQCTDSNTFSLQECSISELTTTSFFHKIVCIESSLASDNYIRIQTKNGQMLTYREDVDKCSFGDASSSQSEENEVFIQVTPCLSGVDSKCFSLMPLKKPGWYLRIYQDQVFVEPRSDPKRADVFYGEASFIASSDADETGYVHIKLASRSLYMTDSSNDSIISQVDMINDTRQDEFRFKILLWISSANRSTDSVVPANNSNSELKYVTIKNAETGIFVRGKAPVLRNLEIISSTSHGIHFTGFQEDEIKLNECFINGSGGSSMLFEITSEAENNKISISNCSFYESFLSSLKWTGAGYMELYNSSFINNTNWAMEIYTQPIRYVSKVLVKSNIISSHGILVSNSRCEACSFTSVEIIENDFFYTLDENWWSAYYTAFLYFAGVNVHLSKNRFISAAVNNFLYIDQGQKFEFHDNCISDGQFSRIIYIANVPRISIVNNQFINNSHFYYQQLNNIFLANYIFESNITNNSFFNPLSTYEVYIDRDWDSSTDSQVDLSNNKWLQSNYSSILAKIYCFFNNINKMPVNIWPAISVVNGVETVITRPTSDSSYFFDNVMGGEVFFSFDFPNTTAEYLVSNSILIPSNVTLTIQYGVTLKFASGRGMVVKGKLVNSELENRILRLANAYKIVFFPLEPEFFILKNIEFDGGFQDTFRFRFQNVVLTNVFVKNLYYGVEITSNNLVLSNCSFQNNNDGLRLYRYNSDNLSAVTIENNLIEGSDHGLTIPLHIDVLKIVNCTIRSNNYGLYLRDETKPNASLEIINTIFENNQVAIIGSCSGPVDIKISQCYFKDSNSSNFFKYASGIDIGINWIQNLWLKGNFYENYINTIIRLTKPSMQIFHGQNIDITGNQFHNSFATSIYIQDLYDVNINIEKCRFTSNMNNTNIKDKTSGIEVQFNFIMYPPFNNWPSVDMLIRSNIFEKNGGQQVLKLWSPSGRESFLQDFFSTTGSSFEILSNSFLGNIAFESVVSTNIIVANFWNNIFSNPLTQYDVAATFTSNFVQNCSLNWWGSGNKTQIRSRIKDKYVNASLGEILYEPFLNKSEFTCLGVNSCSKHGFCVGFDMCQCTEGWMGESCNNFTCSKVYNCLGRGECVAPDVCSCKSGWSGADCSKVSCFEANDCSGRGVCIRPNECQCSAAYSGFNCTECSVGRWGPDCISCPNCNHGICDKQNGKCICNSPNWAGEFCDQCAPKYFGPLCLPLVKLSSVLPESGPDIGGSEVFILGYNLPNATAYKCRFDGKIEVIGTWISEGKVSCISPQHDAGVVEIELLVPPDTGYRVEKFKFTYNPVCPASACGSKEFPVRGFCNFGRCNCYVPWIGDDCDQLGLAPKISTVQQTLTLLENQDFNMQLNITEGSLPIRWTLLNSPSELTIGASSGLLSWNKVPAYSQLYFIKIQCSNLYGRNELQLNLSVPPSYTAVLDNLPQGVLTQPKPMVISGKIKWLIENIYLKGISIPLKLLIKSSYGLRNISLLSNPLVSNGTFYTRFFPLMTEVGLTELDARHPVDEGFTSQQSWRVYGMSISLSTSSISEYIGSYQYLNFLTLSNTGVDPLSNIQIAMVDTPFELTFFRNSSPPIRCSIKALNCTILNYLEPKQTVIVAAELKATEAYSGYFSIVVQTKENFAARSRFSYDFQQKTPVFKMSKSQISATVSRGSSYTEEIQITNVGLKAATNVKPNFPSGTLLSFISFGTNSSLITDLSKTGLILDSGETAALVFSFTPSASESIGDVNGVISIIALENRATISFRFVISSTNKLDLIIHVEDEYTYFSQDKPLLSGAKILLTSKYGGETLNIISHTNGTGRFLNITEGYYDLYTSAEKHLPDSRVIFASMGEKSQITVFLQRTAVTYGFSVVPVPFEDRYDFVVQADFATNVPIPVVTMEPTKIDLDELETGVVPHVQITITNHGLIAANNFHFILPTADFHPYLTLTMRNTDIGNIPANTTIFALLEVNINDTKKETFLRQRNNGVSKRNIKKIVDVFFSALKGIYEYFCKENRQQEIIILIYNKISLVIIWDFFIDDSSINVPKIPQFDFNFTIPDIVKNIPKITSISCNCGLNLPITCYEAMNTIASCLSFAFGAAATVYDCLFTPPEERSIWKCIPLRIVDAIECGFGFPDVIKCLKLIYECFSKSNSQTTRQKRDAVLSKGDLWPVMAYRFLAVYKFIELGNASVGDNEWFHLNGSLKRWWLESFEPVFSETSEGGELVTVSELNNILNSPLPGNASEDMVKRLVFRYNSSFYDWSKGEQMPKEGQIDSEEIQNIRNKLIDYDNEAKQANKKNLIEWYTDAYEQYKTVDEQPDQGVCAKVRIQIKQKMTLIRTGFEALFYLDNGESSTLSNIRIDIKISTYSGNKSDATDDFAIGKPILTGITDVTGLGRLEIGVKGTATWLIIPYSSAAPTSDVQYRVGGTLYYSIGSENLTVPLFPDTITVKPDPRLVVNYFLEKYVYSDDPFTPAIEPAVPFTLGILITNDGYGPATSLKITSSQPEIIDNEKGLLINFQIIGTQLAGKEISPSLTINFGDIAPHSTQAAKWIMTCSLSGTFSNYSATFQNTNPLGDPRLSVLEKLAIHELLHAVMIDYPTSDFIADFLVVDLNVKLDLEPTAVYDSSDGINPLNVSTCNASIISASQDLVKITSDCPTNGWVFTRVLYQSTQDNTITAALRDNIKQIDATYNVWIQRLSKKNYLQIFDFIERKGTYIYDVHFNTKNLLEPSFSAEVYSVNVSEDIKIGSTVYQLTATDQNSIITYQISQKTSEPNLPFDLDPGNGIFKTSKSLDREVTSYYNLVVLAIDNGIPPKTGTAIVSINVTDVNDNAPAITGIESELYLGSITPLNFVIGTVKVTDADEGLNAQVTVALSGNADFLMYDRSTGNISVKSALTSFLGKYSYYIIAEDSGSPPLKTNFNFTVNVIKPNNYSPQFDQSKYSFYVNETNVTGISIGNVHATDADDSREKLIYDLISDLSIPFIIDTATGEITNSYYLYSLAEETKYSFLVSVTDNGAPPTGKLTSTANVTIYIMDVNDHPPRFPQPSYTVSIKENTVNETVLLSLEVTDADFGKNRLIESVTLKLISPKLAPNLIPFKLNVTSGVVSLISAQPLDREIYEEYILEITATDSGIPPLSSSTNVTVIVENVNDCTPVFENPSASRVVSSTVPVNSLLYTLNATDCDKESKIQYMTVASSAYESSFIILNQEDGTIRLAKSLRKLNFSTIELNIKATDGELVSNVFKLDIVISDINIYPPVFEQSVYNVKINESNPVGSQILTLSATDKDSINLYFYISDESAADRTFSLDFITGDLMLAKSLDYETKKLYTLVVIVFDNLNRSLALNNTAEVIIEVINVNEFPPVFENVVGSGLKIPEGNVYSNVFQFITSDKDNDSVSLSILPGQDALYFSLDPFTGWLSVVKPLKRSVSSKILIQILATDDGNPPLTTTADIEIEITERPTTTPPTAPTTTTRPTTTTTPTTKTTPTATTTPTTKTTPTVTTTSATTTTPATTPTTTATPTLSNNIANVCCVGYKIQAIGLLFTLLVPFAQIRF